MRGHKILGTSGLTSASPAPTFKASRIATNMDRPSRKVRSNEIMPKYDEIGTKDSVGLIHDVLCPGISRKCRFL